MAAAKVVHVEVVGPNGGVLQRFYSELFGWNLDTNNPGGTGWRAPSGPTWAPGSGRHRTAAPAM